MTEISQTTSEEKLATVLQLAQLQRHIEAIKQVYPNLEELAKGSHDLREHIVDELTNYALSIKTAKLDKDHLKAFFDHPYHLYKEKRDKENTWHLAIPKFIDVQFGWLEKVTESHNVFLINRYVDWLGELPDVLKKKLGMKDPLQVFLDGNILVGRDAKKAADKYKAFISGEDAQGNPIINKAKHFELLATLIKDGVLPFTPRPVSKDLLVQSRCDIELRTYQMDAWNALLKYSNIGVFFPPSTGKTFVGIYVCTHIKPPHLIAVPTTMLVEQWTERLELYTDLKSGIDFDVMTYQSAIKHHGKKQYNSLIIDEVHHLPSNEFSRMAVIPRKVTVGLSATPQREDEREEYIFALTGWPVGVSWDQFKQLGIIQSPPLHVWIVKNDTERMNKVSELLQEPRKTIIFSDSIEAGATMSKRLGIPHVYGESKDKLATIQNADVSVVSRVGDEGMSLPDIERVIEISWLFGSRRQELQRFTRLLHGQKTDAEGHIIMTAEEYQHDHKRLFGIMDRGFKIILHRQGISDKIFDTEKQERKPRPVRIVSSTPRQQAITANDFELSHPMLSLPGIQKKLAQCTKAERLAVRVLYERAGQEMTKEQVWNLVGLGRPGDFANFGKLIDLKLIKKVNKGYQAI